jgi:hypothetical protein
MAEVLKCPCAFCLRSDGTPYVGQDLEGQAVYWIFEMFPDELTEMLFPPEDPVPGVWVQVPRHLRPAGMAHAFFNAHAFLKTIRPNSKEQRTVRERAQPRRHFSGRGRRMG